MTKTEKELTISVPDRVLSAFFRDLQEDRNLIDVADRLKTELLGTDSPKEDALRRAMFGEGTV